LVVSCWRVARVPAHWPVCVRAGGFLCVLVALQRTLGFSAECGLQTAVCRAHWATHAAPNEPLSHTHTHSERGPDKQRRRIRVITVITGELAASQPCRVWPPAKCRQWTCAGRTCGPRGAPPAEGRPGRRLGPLVCLAGQRKGKERTSGRADEWTSGRVSSTTGRWANRRRTNRAHTSESCGNWSMSNGALSADPSARTVIAIGQAL